MAMHLNKIAKNAPHLKIESYLCQSFSCSTALYASPKMNGSNTHNTREYRIFEHI